MDQIQEQYGPRRVPQPPTGFVLPEELKGALKALNNIDLSRYKWSNIVIVTVLHVLCVVGYVHTMTHDIKVQTFRLAIFLGLFTGMGLTVGAHRLWSHRSFRARLPLRLMLAFFQSMTMAGSAYSFARDHRTHHKFSDTEGDPKNPNRGLFYSHIGWWMIKKTQAVKDAGSKLDFSDLRQDLVCWYQHKYYTPLFVVFGVLLPTWVPWYFFGEDPLNAFYVCCVIRIVVVLHHFFTVNSIAHFFGYRPYDFRMRPAENRLVIYLSLGEGNHNFHHTFPFDYATSEKYSWEFFNLGALFIDINAWLGLAYNRKKASKAVIEGTIKRRGIEGHAAFDPPGTLPSRILYGIFDWIVGLIVAIWPVFPIILFKYFTGQPIFAS